MTMRTLILTLALLCTTSHAALRRNGSGTTPKPTAPPPTNPVPPVTGGGLPTTVCLLYPALCVQ